MHPHHLLPFLLAIIPSITSSPIEARTCPSTNIISDPSFESGVTPAASAPNPWQVVGFIGSSSYSLTQPGSPNGGGKYAFTASLYPGPYSGGRSGETLVQTMKTCAGKNYSIIADIKFEKAQNNACSLSLQYPYKDTIGSVTTGSATPGTTPGQWSQTGSTFQAVSNADKLSFVFRCEGVGVSVNNFISVDNVKVAPFAGNAF
ncbi:MAG: hypothetical protein Q9208_005015 [Pyrenodesmia sp. 3 TL-2023]